jgi:hypothetical protein
MTPFENRRQQLAALQQGPARNDARLNTQETTFMNESSRAESQSTTANNGNITVKERIAYYEAVEATELYRKLRPYLAVRLMHEGNGALLIDALMTTDQDVFPIDADDQLVISRVGDHWRISTPSSEEASGPR